MRLFLDQHALPGAVTAARKLFPRRVTRIHACGPTELEQLASVPKNWIVQCDDEREADNISAGINLPPPDAFFQAYENREALLRQYPRLSTDGGFYGVPNTVHTDPDLQWIEPWDRTRRFAYALLAQCKWCFVVLYMGTRDGSVVDMGAFHVPNNLSLALEMHTNVIVQTHRRALAPDTLELASDDIFRTHIERIVDYRWLKDESSSRSSPAPGGRMVDGIMLWTGGDVNFRQYSMMDPSTTLDDATRAAIPISKARWPAGFADIDAMKVDAEAEQIRTLELMHEGGL